MEKQRIYAKYIKRLLDIICSALFLLMFCWLYIIIAALVRIKLGTPVLFRQIRPFKDEKLGNLIKFRTMTDERDKNGNLLSDEKRLTSFGKSLRSSSLDEIPEMWLVFLGKLSLVGPRPLLVKDMTFMTEEQRKRHIVRPGLTGLAQVHGRNAIKWEDKLDYDLQYVQKITFCSDMKILLLTVLKVLKREGISEEGMATAEDLGDYLLREGKIGKEEYDAKQTEARRLLKLGVEKGKGVY